MNNIPRDHGFATTPGALPSDAASAASDLPGASGTVPTGEMPGTAENWLTSLESAMERGDLWMRSCRSEVRAHPMGAVLMAFAAGMLLGRARRPFSKGHRP